MGRCLYFSVSGCRTYDYAKYLNAQANIIYINKPLYYAINTYHG